MRVLVVDHFDSFAFVLGDQFARLGAEVCTLRCRVDLATYRQVLRDRDPDLVVLSPGPGRPEDTGVTVPWLRQRPEVPVLGICLGHQAMAVAAGGEVGRAPAPVHGRACQIALRPHPLLADLPRRFPAARYHSLVVTRMPDEFEVLATTNDGGAELVMAMHHRELPYVGLQFHPESFLTPWGGRLLAAVLARAGEHRQSRTSHRTE